MRGGPQPRQHLGKSAAHRFRRLRSATRSAQIMVRGSFCKDVWLAAAETAAMKPQLSWFDGINPEPCRGARFRYWGRIPPPLSRRSRRRRYGWSVAAARRRFHRPGSAAARVDAQQVALEGAVGFGGVIDHLDHHDRLVTVEIAIPQRAESRVMVEPLGAGIAPKDRTARPGDLRFS
jgi:hypothetical protein